MFRPEYPSLAVGIVPLLFFLSSETPTMDAFCRKPTSSSTDPSIEAEVKRAMLIVRPLICWITSRNLSKGNLKAAKL